MVDNNISPNCPRVDVVVPCYNVEKYIVRFIDSLVLQTYKQINIIFVNDGSTDKTITLIRESLPRLEAEGYPVKVLDQENRGLAGAIDAGLKHFTGEFLTWPDPDDWLPPDSIECRVARMLEYPEAGLLRTVAKQFIQKRDEFDGYLGTPGAKPCWRPDIFSQFFLGRTHYHPVCHFARSSAFLETTGRSIHVAPGGNSQNLQMLLPLTEMYPTIETGDVCANYTVRDDSRSRRDVTAEPKIRRIMMLLNNLLQTIPKLKGNHDDYRRIAEQAWLRNRLLIAAFEGNLPAAAESVLHRCGLSPARTLLARIALNGKTRLMPNRNQLTLEKQQAPLSSRAFLKLVRFDPESVKLPLVHHASN